MNQSRRQLDRGKRALSRHNPETALKSLESALKLCPVENRRELSQVFYYLGLTLLRLDKPNGAVRSFRAAVRLRKRHCYSRAMLARFGNDYGMARQANPALDDWAAFYSIHLQRYLRSKANQRVSTEAEGDMIKDLIRDYWRLLLDRRLLDGKSCEEKLELFRSVEVIFPFYMQSEPYDEKVISVDFQRKLRLSGENRCRCGSGMPFRMCCGRTQGAEELLPGTF